MPRAASGAISQATPRNGLVAGGVHDWLVTWEAQLDVFTLGKEHWKFIVICNNDAHNWKLSYFYYYQTNYRGREKMHVPLISTLLLVFSAHTKTKKTSMPFLLPWPTTIYLL